MHFTNSFDVDDADKQMEQISEQMHHISDPSKIRDLMRETAKYRWDLVHKAESPDLAEILVKFPHLLDVGMVCLIGKKRKIS